LIRFKLLHVLHLSHVQYKSMHFTLRLYQLVLNLWILSPESRLIKFMLSHNIIRLSLIVTECHIIEKPLVRTLCILRLGVHEIIGPAKERFPNLYCLHSALVSAKQLTVLSFFFKMLYSIDKLSLHVVFADCTEPNSHTDFQHLKT
jgi:hypothetical protein